MNKRIQELAEQAELNATLLFNKDKLEEFAQLIVKECALTVQDFVDHRFPASEYPNRLKRYFGVEE